MEDGFVEPWDMFAFAQELAAQLPLVNLISSFHSNKIRPEAQEAKWHQNAFLFMVDQVMMWRLQLDRVITKGEGPSVLTSSKTNEVLYIGYPEIMSRLNNEAIDAYFYDPYCMSYITCRTCHGIITNEGYHKKNTCVDYCAACFKEEKSDDYEFFTNPNGWDGVMRIDKISDIYDDGRLEIKCSDCHSLITTEWVHENGGSRDFCMDCALKTDLLFSIYVFHFQYFSSSFYDFLKMRFIFEGLIKLIK